MPETQRGRIAGVTVPLFSLRGPGSWGIGEIGDLPSFARWMKESGVRLVQLLPLGEISGGETSPYGALTAFGIDPIYISLADVPDLGADAQAALDRARLHLHQSDSAYAVLGRARDSRDVDYGAVRSLKQHALRVAFSRFYEGELLPGTPRAAAFRAFVTQNESWLVDYALFRALKAKKNTPKYGLIYNASIVGSAKAQLKGKISRTLANKCALCVRYDALGEDVDPDAGHQVAPQR